MTGRDRERDRDRAPRAQQAASARTNEYFVPKDGIDREVITADICRYLGNDALVRPGTYENPQTRQVQQGYFITAYRNLTTAMIADLKADSARWEAERMQTASRGVEYRSSTTHQSRQYYGPTEATPGVTPVYPSGSSMPQYDSGAQYQSPGYPSQSSYASTPSYATAGYAPTDNYYVAGADLRSERSSSGLGPTSQQVGGQIPRAAGNVQYASTPTTYQQPDSRTYYSSQPATQISSSSQYPTQQPSDPFYGRAAPATGNYGDAGPEIYDSRAHQYPDTVTYSQAPITSSTTTATSSSRRRDDRDDRDRHHSSRRR